MPVSRRKLTKTTRAIVIGAASTAACAAMCSTAAATASAKATSTVVTTRQGPFGTMLVAGSGPFAGYTLYLITSDALPKFGCTPVVIKSLPGGPGSCTGPATDKKAEWPAFTTTGPVVAGAGVRKGLLGTVQRPGIGRQVTYAGHPLYLFDTGPGQVTGIGWDEPTLPPWHGLWWGVTPSGAPLAWPGTLSTTTIGGRHVLAALMLTGIGWEPFPVYSFSKDSPSSSACAGACAVSWPPLITDGMAGTQSGISPSDVATLKRPDGTTQLAYKGAPLYLFASEAIAPVGGNLVATGSGSGARVDGGIFHLVSP